MKYYNEDGEFLNVDYHTQRECWEWYYGTDDVVYGGGFRDSKEEAISSAITYIKFRWDVLSAARINKIEEVLSL